ncbi:hypothetical protein EMIHUDRAFT_228333 [Emiliania huxleyi CCMP1516]|uniref:Uncharacterized protein n=2 Tax=Emiliania huxleyi TaxID=2903 RepID=A0A0D3KGA2_EMIH1|nr:hypothetical protein EMIHUDRAFT_228333 [Emiliania huxleyi CCMP1516]EOD34787.1 hypothetical protein EMIHUDRAFT_228333 [Emiliania huxleyi CCMP1516]|eukprot:XP_005787216.1 hypothetical protein EMIHUDRAFT_228333 [Emiliania huxleyi CCMP1516]
MAVIGCAAVAAARLCRGGCCAHAAAPLSRETAGDAARGRRWCQGQLNCQGWCQGQINCLAGDCQVVDVVRRRLRHPRASAPRSKKSALYQEVPKQQHLHEVSVVRFAAACRRCADWLPYPLIFSRESEQRSKHASAAGSDGISDGVFTERLRAHADEEYSSSVCAAVRSRLGWLALFLVGLWGAAFVIDWFEHMLQRNVELAHFVPLIIGHGGNAARLGSNPALTSAPLMTTVIDSSGLLIYFLVAWAYYDFGEAHHLVDQHHSLPHHHGGRSTHGGQRGPGSHPLRNLTGF